MALKIGIPREIFLGEKRVAATPDVITKIKKLGFEVLVERAAGSAASIPDSDYQAAGAELVGDSTTLWQRSDIILKVRAPETSEVSLLGAGKTLISFIWPGQNGELMKKLAATRANVLAMDSVPRISRAQKLDALSSMANIAGYRAVIEAAHEFGRFFTGQITAAGKVPPAKVLVIGAGVAGLSAIGAASGLGAVVRAFDTRPEVKDQVKSMGGEFLELDFKEEGAGAGGYAKEMSPAFIEAEMKLFAEQAKDVDIIITTALIPGKKAPLLIKASTARLMKPGSVIVDMAAEQGGNCELTEAGKVVVKDGVTLIGYTDLPSRLAKQSSQLYGNNLWRLLEELCPKKDGTISINMEDEVFRGTTVIKAGEITWPPPPAKLSMAPAATEKNEVSKKAAEPEKKSAVGNVIACLLAVGMFAIIGQYAPPAFQGQFTVFILACFVGYMVVWNVTASLHTPLMSVTNAISGIIAIGALVQISSDNQIVQALAAVAILVATINIVGGFMVTHRMLKMFRK